MQLVKLGRSVISGLAILSLLAGPALAVERDDYHQNEFPHRPAPDWVRMIDQGTVAPALAGIHTPAGIKVEIVAQEPTVVDPVGMTFDRHGAPYVLEWRVAGQGKHAAYEQKLMDGTTVTVNRMVKDTKDELKTLRDTDGDGRWDTARVLMDDLEIPSSVMLHDGWVYLSGVGKIIRRRQSKPGGPFDVTEEIVRGLCGFHHHQASGMTISHDGWLFITSGDDDNHGEGSDGSRATVLRTGAVFRCRPDGSRLSEYARGFRNPYRDVSFDHYWNMFHVDNDQEDGSKFQGVRLMHVQEGSDFGWRLLPGAVCCRTDFARGAVFGEKPGKVPSMLKTGRGSPAGLLIYQGRRFPDFFRGLLIYPDVYRKLVRAYQVQRDGTTFKVTRQFVLMTSEDGLFRPCQAVAGPDGAIYIVDWRTDHGGAGRLWGDGQHGRIYRLTWSGIEGTPAIEPGPIDAWARLGGASDEDLFALLDTPDFELRRQALEELCRRARADGADPAQYRARFTAIASDKSRSGPARAAAIGGASRFYDDHVQRAMADLLRDPQENPELRRLAADAISRHASSDLASSTHLPSRLESCLSGETDPIVRRAAALTLGTLAGRLAGEPGGKWSRVAAARTLFDALGQLRRDDDVYLWDGVVRGLERTGGEGLQHLATYVLDGDDDERETAVGALEAMRTRAAAQALDRVLRAGTASLSGDQVQRLIEAYRYIQVEPPIRADAVAEWLVGHPEAPLNVQLAGLETLGLVGGGEADQIRRLVLRLLESESLDARVRVIGAVGQLGLNSLAKPLVAALRDAERSIDERRAIVDALGRLRSRSLPFTGRKTPPGVEAVLDELAAVAEDPEQGVIRGEALGLLSQVDYGKARPLARKLLESGDSLAVSSAIDVLGARPEEARRIGGLFLDGKIDRAMLPRVAAALRRHVPNEKDGEFTRLLSDVFRGGLLVSLDPAEVKRVETLVRQTGDPLRGRAVYLDEKRTQCAKCHQLEGFGGKIGPDLSKVWQSHNVSALMKSILAPSADIKEGFGTWTVVTLGGQVYTGLKITDTRQEVVLRDANGKDVRIPADEIDEKIQAKKSLMPEGVIAQLSFQEFVDLIAFLKDRETQQTLGAQGK